MISKIKKIIYNLPLKKILINCILFESNPDYTDNAYYVYKELMRQEYNKKYKLIWLVKDAKRFNDIHEYNVKFIKRKSVEAKIYRILAKNIIDCNNYIYKYNKYQFRIFLGHGMPIKIIPEYFSQAGELDYYLLTSEHFIDYYEKYAKIGTKKYIFLGYPRNDQLFENKEYFEGLENYKKIIIWMPTYRKNGNRVGYTVSYNYGIPSINNEKELLKLNKYLSKNNSLLIVKLHPAESISNTKKIRLSNILFTKNELLENNNKNIYQLLQLSDALITDYSSVYFDYMLMDKPIGMSVEDINEYKKQFGIYFDDLEKELPAEYIYNYEDLFKFIENVCNDIDIMKDERNKMKKIYFKYTDGKSSKRIVDFLRDKML